MGADSWNHCGAEYEEFSIVDTHNLFILFHINTVDKASNCVKYIFQQEKNVIVFVIVILNSMNC